jgi:hypothetical protein
MTYSITNVEQENRGSADSVVATVDITSLDSAGFEPFDPSAALGIDDVADYGARVCGQENTAYLIRWDTANSRISVVNVSDGTDVTSTTDVGEVVLEFVGY